jgi:uncharacterized protein involved in exopolysaccharide biosynthesis
MKIFEPTEVLDDVDLRTADDKDEVDILETFLILVRRKRLIASVTLTSVVLAVVVSLLIPNRYTATAKIMPPQETQSAASMLLNQLTGGGAGALASLAGKDLGLKNPNDIYIGMLKSRTVQDALIKKYDLSRVYDKEKSSDVRRELGNATDIQSGQDGLINISVEDEDPSRATNIANSYVSELRELTQRLAVTEASERRLFFEQQLKDAKNALADAEVGLKETQQKTGMIDLDDQAKAIIEAVAAVRGLIAAKEVQLQSMQTFATERNPDYLLLQQELAALRVQQSKLERQESGGHGDPVVATAKVPAVALEYVRKLREVKYRETVFTLLAQQFEMAKLDETKTGAVIQVLDEAVVPDKKSSPKRAMIVILVFIGAFALSAGYALLADALVRAQEDRGRSAQIAELRAFLRVPLGRSSR